MTDLEMTRLCAEAMGITFLTDEDGTLTSSVGIYVPHQNNEQAMELVKKFHLRINHNDVDKWLVCKDYGFRRPPDRALNPDLNRAIFECVAKMQAAKK